MSSASSEVAAPRQLAEINRPTAWWLAPLLLWKNIYQHRFLVRSFISRDLRIRYRYSILGYLWSLVEPLLLTATYYVLFTVVAGRPQKRYAMWVVIGVLVWQYFAKCLNSSVGSLTKNAGIIKQVYFPREIFAITAAGSHLVIACLSLLVVIPFAAYYGVVPNGYLLMVPLGLLLTASLGLGIGLACACLNAVHRDVEHFFKFIIRAGFFLSPVMWTLDEPRARGGVIDTLLYNPMAIPITMVRNGIEGRPLNPEVSTAKLIYCIAFCIGAFVVGAMFFKRFESEAVKNV